ncbi:hypothetical protein ACFLYF_02905 [Chloroflexota bacterium]
MKLTRLTLWRLDTIIRQGSGSTCASDLWVMNAGEAGLFLRGDIPD